MRQPVFDCHKFTPNCLCRLYLSSLTVATTLVLTVSGSQSVLAQVNSAPSVGTSYFANSQFGFGGLLPVPQSPKVRGRQQNSQLPPPPTSTDSPLSSTNSLHGENTASLTQLENEIIQQQGGKKTTSPSSIPALSSSSSILEMAATKPTLNHGNFASLAVTPTVNNPADKQLTNKLTVPHTPANTSTANLFANQTANSTREFVAPGVSNNPVNHGAPPTFNQLLNSSPTQVAPLPPLPGETVPSNLGVNTPANSNLTFNQLLNGDRNPTPTATNLPTFNQLLNSRREPATPGINHQNHQSPPQNPTFSQLFSAQGGSQAGVNESMRTNPTTTTPLANSNRNPANQPLIKSTALTQPSLTLQGMYVTQGGDTSARARLSGILPLTPNALFGATLDLTSDGSSFDDSRREGLNINELYFATSLAGLPNLRFAVGQLDLTSYFDRNSFAKDGASHFFNPVFQTNPALAVAGISSRTGMLVNWSVTDNIDAKAAVFSSADRLSSFALDGFAGEIGIRYGNAIIRGTYVTNRDAGNRDSFPESFSIARGENRFGPQRDDREEAYGLNAEVFIPNLKMGLFGRYGRFENRDLGRGADTYLLGASFLDVFTGDDRLGIAYGRELSNDSLRRGAYPDVVELFYDFKFLPNLRLGFTVQGRDNLEETVIGVRVKSEFDVTPRGSINR